MSYWPSTNNGHHPHMSSINHPIYTQPATTAPQSTYSTQMHAQPSYMPSTDAFYIREINKALASQIGSHFDKGFNTLQDTLLQRISSQDNILSKQQQILESLSCLVTSRHDDSIKEQETLRIELLELKEKSDSQTRSTGLAMKQLAGETIKNIRDSRCAIELKLLCVEESLESLVEEIRDPQANMNELVHHEVAVGPSSPVATPSYRDVGVTPDIIASQPLPIPASPFRASEPIHLPENPSNCGGWDTQHNDNVHSVYENSDYPVVRSPAACTGRSPSAPSGGIPEQQLTGRRPHNTVNPRDTLHAPQSLLGSGTVYEQEHEQDHPADQATYDDRAPVEQSDIADLNALNLTTFNSQASRHSTLTSELNPPLSPLSSIGTMSSPARVMNDLLPSSDVVWQGQSISSRSSQAPQESYPGSTEVSTISLPEPSALLEECFNSPGPKGKAPVPTAIMPTTPAKIHTIDIDSLSPLSSIPSDYAPSLHGGNLSIRPPGNRGRKSESASQPKVVTPTSGKRRRSSPGPKREKPAKRPRKRAQTASTKKAKKELLDESHLLRGNGVSKQPKGNSASQSLTKLGVSQDPKSRQFIQCDKCALWYHWGCAGVQDNDPRLQANKDFICRPCEGNGSHGQPDLGKNGKGETCSWPDCNVDDDAASEEEFFVEKIIGRFDRKEKGIDRFTWLVKWEGYSAEESTWTPNNDLANVTKLAEDFETVAKAEGISLSASSLTLLKEAVDAGFIQPSD